MSMLAWTSIGLGCFVIATRGPLLVAPAATLDFLRWILGAPIRIRLLGLVVTGLGALMILGSSAEERVFASILSFFGWYAVVAGFGSLVLFPSLYKALAEWLIDNMADVMQPLGGFGVALGIALVWFGLILD
ncbi:MAG: hypothetical protein JRH17_16850 [Deltaproteobacteria bacterium]|nr:hypothetical protein [Deltaproteobacteria bacterium]